jgi:predicted GNAT family N-acyltransferase
LPISKKSFIFAKKMFNIYFKNIVYGTPEYREILALRSRTLREPLGLHFSDNDLTAEKDDIFTGAYIQGNTRPAGCFVLTRLTSDAVQLRQMAVDEQYRNAGIGGLMLRRAEETARADGYRQIVLHARKTALNFYAKYGYTVVGEDFTEVGIPHRLMKKTL